MDSGRSDDRPADLDDEPTMIGDSTSRAGTPPESGATPTDADDPFGYGDPVSPHAAPTAPANDPTAEPNAPGAEPMTDTPTTPSAADVDVPTEMSPPGDVQVRSRQTERDDDDARSPLLAFVVGVALLLGVAALYTLTLTPSFGTGSDALRQINAIELNLGGNADDTPLYVAVAHLMTKSELTPDRAQLVTWTSAVCGALTVLVVFLCGLKLLDRARLGTARGRVLFASIGAGSLAIAHGFWLHAVTPAPGSLGTLLFALVIWMWVRRLAGGAPANIVLGSFLTGLLLAVDIGFVVVVPIFLISGWWLLWRPQRIEERVAKQSTTVGGALVSLLFAFMIGALPFLAAQVIELATAPRPTEVVVLPSKDVGAVLAVVGEVGRQAVSGRIVPLASAASATQKFAAFGTVHAYNFMIATILGLVGALALLVRPGAIRSGLLLVILMAIAVASAVYLPSIDPAGAALPAAVVFALWVTTGSAAIFRRATPIIAGILVLLVIALPVGAYYGAAALVDRQATLQQIAGTVEDDATVAHQVSLVPWRQSSQPGAIRMGADGSIIGKPDMDRPTDFAPDFDRDYESPLEEAPFDGRSPWSDEEGRRRASDPGEGLTPLELQHESTNPYDVSAPETATSTDTNQASALAEADRLYSAGQFWQASAIYRALLPERTTPGTVVDPELQARYAVSLAEARFPSGSRAIEQTLFTAEHDSVTALTAMSGAYLTAKNADKAREYIDAAIEIAPNDPRTLYWQGRILESLGDPAAAHAAYTRYLELGTQSKTVEVTTRLRAIESQTPGNR